MTSDSSFQDDLGGLPTPNVNLNLAKSFGPLRVLSLTGGGFRGLFTARTLVTVCAQARHTGPLDKSFDVFAGTSIGGLMACALSVGVLPHRVLDAIDAEGATIFEPRKATTMRRALFGTLYDEGHLSKAIDACLGKRGATRMCDLDKGLIIPTVDWVNGQVKVLLSGFFGAAHASEATLKEVCLATSAAPTYFKPGEIDGLPMLDGGLSVNNPDMLALTQIMTRRPGLMPNVEMLSIGTAGYSAPRSADKAERWGVGWLQDLPSFMMTVQERSAALQAQQLLDDRYLRLNHAGEPIEAFMKLDHASSQARDRLWAAADETAKLAYATNPAFIDRMFSPLRAAP